MLENAIREIYETVSYRSLTETEQERLIVLFAHDIAMAAQAASSKLVRTLVDAELLDVAGTAGYSLWGRAETSRSLNMAVQHNAMAITTSIREDFVNGTHPGAVIFPLVIAEVEHRRLHPEQVLDAAAVGLKVSMLLLDVFGKAASNAGFRPTTAINTMAGAVALAKARGRNADEAMRALSAATGMIQGFALHFQEGTEEWLVQVPLVASAAVLACKNAGALHFSHEKFLTGERSLASLLGVPVTDTVPDVGAGSGSHVHSDANAGAASGLASFNLSLTRLGVKRHPVNSFVQPVVDAALRMVAGLPQSSIDVKGIDEVVVSVPTGFQVMSATLLNRGPLSSPNLGILSLPVSTALALINGKLDFADFRHANDAAVLELAEKIHVVFSDALKGYDVEIRVAAAGEEHHASCPTDFFYPSLAQELTWVQQQVGATVLPWVDRLTEVYQRRR